MNHHFVRGLRLPRLLCLGVLVWIAIPVAARANVQYQDGGILTSPQIVVVYWGDNVPRNVQTEAPGIYRSIVQLSDFDWLSEYDTPTQHIVRGAFLDSFAIAPSDIRTNLLDRDIEAELVAQIAAGKLPPASDDTYYAVYMPPGMEIREGFWEDKSCKIWSAYHGDLGPALRATYAVFPTCDPTCTRDCPSSPDAVHELFEATTDPHFDGWTNDVTGDEIADLCSHSDSSLGLPDGGALKVQRLWSNRFNSCIASEHEFALSLNPYQAAASTDYEFEIVATGPAVPLGQPSWSLSGLPDGVTYSLVPGPGPSSPWVLTLHMAQPFKEFSFVVEGQSGSWTATVSGRIFVEAQASVQSPSSQGCTLAPGAGPDPLLALLTALGLIVGLRRRTPCSQDVQSR